MASLPAFVRLAQANTVHGPLRGHLAKATGNGDNRDVKKEHSTRLSENVSSLLADPFMPGTLAVVSLAGPKGKFWGRVLAMAPAGLSLCGADVASLEDIAAMVRDGERCVPSVVFFPMHRVERMELDLPNGTVPSLAERLQATTGLQAETWLLPGNTNDHTALAKVRGGAALRGAGRTR